MSDHQKREESDGELVTRALADKEAFVFIVARYEARLDRYVRRLGVTLTTDRLDVLQEIFIKIYKKLNDFDHSLPFASWAYKIAHNETISWLRKRNVRPEGHIVMRSDEFLSLMSLDAWSQELKFDTQLQIESLARAFKNLSHKYQYVMMLRFFEYKEYSEISDILKIPIGSVSTLIYRAKKQLREMIAKDNQI